MIRRSVFGGVLAAVIVMTCATSAWAQVGGGIKAGVNLAKINGFNDPGASTSQRTGLVIGVFMTAGIVPMVTFQPEILYSMQGSKFHFTSGGLSTDANIKLDYLQIPLLLRFGNSGKNVASAYALVGPTFGLLMNAKQDGVDIKPQLKNVDAGLVLGAGVSLTRFLIEARYTYGLTDLNKTSTPNESNKTRVLSIFVGIAF